MSEASCTWSGKIPQKNYRSPASFSCKVFLGGVPWDITEGTCCGGVSPGTSLKVHVVVVRPLGHHCNLNVGNANIWYNI